jgi:hypothetical protein
VLWRTELLRGVLPPHAGATDGGASRRTQVNLFRARGSTRREATIRRRLRRSSRTTRASTSCDPMFMRGGARNAHAELFILYQLR